MIDTASTAQQGDVTTRGSNLAVNDIKKKKNNLVMVPFLPYNILC